jgi:hypothetical protein
VNRRIAAILASVALALSMSVITASPASAYPRDCSYNVSYPNDGWALCTGGTGYYRVVIGCKNVFGWWANRYGPWYKVSGSSSYSWAKCPFGYSVKWAGLSLSD